ncbi:hypothetical protein QYE76_025179 [Lolium multiflorum]|uniref:Arabidopsis retrotransposon Orf1 C-terminal domain-containing protein n=1 Tax=Lolium multiflorum TaxID=4521 RepID=A0AAD8RGF7_LOLMU|nr:hypothetical protein QYE76_025179 [Lolium multiflorum]
MGKPRDTKVAILPSTTRKGTTLSTSAALDSPSVIDKLVSPPHASHAGTSARSENSSYNFDDASAVLDNDGSLGSFLDATIARSRQIENPETPNENAATPVNSPESVEYSSDDLDEDYVELDDDFIDKCNATTDARKIKSCLHNMKRTPDDVEELLAKIGRNHDDWSTPEPTLTPILKKRGMIKLNDEDMREAKKSLKEKGLLDDFLTLVGKAGLTTYMGDEREQYHMLTKIFVESFKFNNKHYHPTVAFGIYGNPITMKLKDFCTALDIAPVGTAKRIKDNPRDLLELYREITNDDCRTIQRGKIRNIQLPAIKYFAYYLATSILGSENTSNISSYHLAFLIAALTGETPYHLGALIARRLSNRGPIFGETIASRILAYLELPLDPTDVKLTPIRLDIAAMKNHQFVTADSSLDDIVYRMLFSDGEEREVPLPQPDLFSVDRKPWSRSKEEMDEKMKIEGFHQQHDSEDAEPSYDYTVTYPGASSSTYPEYDPSSSYYGGPTSWAPWD